MEIALPFYLLYSTNLPRLQISLRKMCRLKYMLSKTDESTCTLYNPVLLMLNVKTISSLKGINRPFGGGVESILIRSVFVNWRLGKFFLLILNGLHHKISKKLLYAA
jgi:hypothetical protein